MPASGAPAAKAAMPERMREFTCASGEMPPGGAAMDSREALRNASDGATPNSSVNSRSVASTWASAASERPARARALTSRIWALSS